MNRPMRFMRAMLAAAALTVLVSGCHSQPKAGHGEVSGQILPGTVSDAMLPYDTVKSKAPLAPRHSDSGAGADAAADSAASAASGDVAAPDTPASPAPALPAPGN